MAEFKRDSKISTEKMSSKISEVTEGFCFVVSITSLDRPNNRKDKYKMLQWCGCMEKSDEHKQLK
jgi:hypothetical protein